MDCQIFDQICFQEVVTSSFTLYLYAAYLDVRKGNTEGAACDYWA